MVKSFPFHVCPLTFFACTVRVCSRSHAVWHASTARVSRGYAKPDWPLSIAKCEQPGSDESSKNDYALNPGNPGPAIESSLVASQSLLITTKVAVRAGLVVHGSVFPFHPRRTAGVGDGYDRETPAELHPRPACTNERLQSAPASLISP